MLAADARGSGACGRCRGCIRAASRRRALRARGNACAPACPAPSPPCACARWDGGRWARRPRRRTATTPCTSARYSRLHGARGSWRTRSVCAVQRLRHHQQAAWCPCRAGARCPRAATRRCGGTRCSKRVQQRAAAVAAARMHHQPRGLVDHQQFVVLVHDRECDRLGTVLDRDGILGRGASAMRSPPHTLCLAIDARGVQRHAAVLHPAGEAAARMLGKHPRQGLVEPQAGQLPGNVAHDGTGRSARRCAAIICGFPLRIARHHGA